MASLGMSVPMAASSVAATLAVVAAWVLATAVVGLLGAATRRGLWLLFAVSSDARRWHPADLWVGLATICVILPLWNIVRPVDAWVWPLPVLGACIGGWLVLSPSTGLAVGDRPTTGSDRKAGPREPRARATTALTVTVALIVLGATLYLANQALWTSNWYDTGLYHLSSMSLASEYPTPPGLANLHVRLGASNAHLLIASALDVGPWRGGGQHLANGFVAFLFLVTAAAVILDRTTPGTPRFSRRLAVMTIAGGLALVANDASTLLASPNIDISTVFILFAGALCVALAAERQGDAHWILGGLAALAAALATRPQVAPVLAATVVLLWFLLGKQFDRAPLWAGIAPAAVITATIAVRQTLLSGYPLYPLTILGIPVDWKVDAARIDDYREVIGVWARHPGYVDPELVANWSWLRWWVKDAVTQADVWPMLIVTAALLFLIPAAALAIRGGDRAWLRARAWPATLVIAPALVGLGTWFFSAPDPRFALAWIWLVPLAGVAWLTPDRSWFAAAPLLTVCSFLAAFSVAAAYASDDPLLVRATGPGPFGSHDPPRSFTTTVTTSPGLTVSTPVHDDRCWLAPLCTPEPVDGLRLRGASIGDGFVIDPTSPGG